MRSHPYVLLKGQFLGISSISSRTISENWGDVLLSTLSELLQLYNQWNNLEKFSMRLAEYALRKRDADS